MDRTASGASRLPDVRLDEQGRPTGAVCRECGAALGAGYLCDDCDTVAIGDES